MQQIKCPHCGKEFTIDEASYADILSQVKTREFDQEVHEKLELYKKQQASELALMEQKARTEFAAQLAQKEKELFALQAKVESSQQDKQLALMNLPTADAELTSRLAGISGISSIEVNSMLSKFYNEKNAISEALKCRTKQNNTWITDAYKIIADYAKELSIPFDYKIDIFTSNLKAKSGAILHKMVFIYKLAYIKLLSQKLGYPVPIFCDSPSGREVKMETISEMLSVLRRDFGEHQIFISSIHKYESVFDVASVLETNGTLFNEPDLFDIPPQ